MHKKNIIKTRYTRRLVVHCCWVHLIKNFACVTGKRRSTVTMWTDD